MTRSRAQDARSLPRVVVYWRDATTAIRFAVEVNVAQVKDNPLLASDLLPIDGQFGEIKLSKMHATFAWVRAFGPRWIDFEQNLGSPHLFTAPPPNAGGWFYLSKKRRIFA